MIFEPPIVSRARTFEIGKEAFLLDGKPFVIRCGEIHFPRAPREYWRHRLQMCRALGLNAVCVYLFWNFHEWEEGVYDWSGQADAAEFCRIAHEEGLWVLLRPGPYSCAEWEMGGLPWWLTKRDSIRLRSSDPKFLSPAKAYLREVGRVLAPLQITHGGPILMAQVENEYGSFGKDADYMGALRQAMIEGGFEVPLFACDPPGDLANAHRPDLFKVVNFGAAAAKTAFAKLRELQQSGPLMNGEYYPAWFDMWGRRHKIGAAETIVSDLGYMLEKGHSFSIYMAHGGTSFDLWAGADRPFSPDTTSYDYDAPISEAGWITPKFDAIRSLLGNHEALPEPPPANPLITIPAFSLNDFAPLFANLPIGIDDEESRTMERYDQSRGAILYRTTLKPGPAKTLAVEAAHDFAWVYLDGDLVGVLDRRSKSYSLEIPERREATQLDLLVYAMGRVNYGQEVFDQKGLHGPVTLGNIPLTDWKVFCLPLDHRQLESLQYGMPANGPGFWRTRFSLKTAGDTFLDLRGWGKGVVWVNGRCLGRFWNIGPTQTMYLPGPWLNAGENEVVVFDLLGPRKTSLQGLIHPVLDELHPELDFGRPFRAAGPPKLTGLLAAGTFAADADWQILRFLPAAEGRYLCLESISSFGEGASIAELEAIDEHGQALSKAVWKVLWVSSEETNYLPGEAENAIDGQNATYWHTERDAPGPHRFVIDLGQKCRLSGIRYLPASAVDLHSRIRQYRIYLSNEPFGLQIS